MERRKYRDNTEEMTLSLALWGAVLRQAFEDVERLPVVEDLLSTMKESDYKSRVYYLGLKKSLKEERTECRSACKFFEGERLERFITSHTLPLEPTYIRRKYKELKQSLKDRKVEKCSYTQE